MEGQDPDQAMEVQEGNDWHNADQNFLDFLDWCNIGSNDHPANPWCLNIFKQGEFNYNS